MCLTIGKRIVVKYAKKDIIVFKRLYIDKSPGVSPRTMGTSPFKNKQYVKGETVYSPFSFSIFSLRYTGEKGLHAYTTKKAGARNKPRNQSLIQMVIPANAFYIVGENNQIMSSHLCWPSDI